MHIPFYHKQLVLASLPVDFLVSFKRETFGFRFYDGFDERLVELEDLHDMICSVKEIFESMMVGLNLEVWLMLCHDFFLTVFMGRGKLLD
jgi:hypothetical protein